jgi:polyhydroxybutyrate depolymerase
VTRALPLTALLLLPAPTLAAYGPGNNLRNLTHDGELRAYNVYAPSSYDGLSAVPLVVDIHGLSSNKEQEQGLSGWDARADQSGFLVAYPDGLGNSWNAGVCCGSAAANDEDDVGFIRAMVAAIQAEGNVDADRVYATGLSNGGAMTHRLACDAADVFAAAAPLAFPTPYVDFAAGCNPSREIPVLVFMGLTDVLVPYAGGFFGGAVESFEEWRAKNACGGAAPEEHVELGGSYCDVDTSCAGATQVGLCSIRGTAFAPPLDIYSGHILYINDDQVVIPNEIWKFFQHGSLTATAVPGLPPGAAVLVAAGLAGAGAAALRRRRDP